MAAIGVVRLSAEEWIDVPDNPRQRDTERHAQKARKSHLAKYSPAHTSVAAASIDGNIAWKLDGHTRAYLWAAGDLEKPPQPLLVTLYPVANATEAGELYEHFDNQSAVENSKDRLFGACRENGIVLKSPLLRRMTFSNSLRFASTEGRLRRNSYDVNEYDMIPDWKSELIEFDDWGIAYLHGALVGLALLLIRKYQKQPSKLAKIREFFVSLDRGEGTKVGKDRDGVQALAEHLEARRANKTLAGWDNIIDLAERGLSCVNAYLEGRSISGGVRRTSFSTIFPKV